MTIELMRFMPDKPLIFEPFIIAKRVLVARQVCKLFRDEIISYVNKMNVVITKETKIHARHMVNVMKRLQFQNGLGLRLNMGNDLNAMASKITVLLLYPQRLRELHIDTRMCSAKVHDMIFANCDTLEYIEIDTELVQHRKENNKDDYKRLANALNACKCVTEVVLHVEPGLIIGHYDKWIQFMKDVPRFQCVCEKGAWVVLIRMRQHHSGSRKSDTRS